MVRVLIPSMIKALAIDLDGTTLLPNAVLGERTCNCLKKLISKGMQIIITTGRSVEAAEKYRSAIGAEGPLVFFNGAVVIDAPGGRVLKADMIGLDVVDYGIDIARSLGVHYQVYMPAGISAETGEIDANQKWGALVMENFGEEAQDYQNRTGIIPVIKDLKQVVNFPNLEGCIKVMFLCEQSFHEEIRKRMYDRFGDKVEIMRTFPTFLEVATKGVSKGEGLKFAMQQRGLKSHEVVAFGDEENDLSMFKVADFSGAPASAREEIRKAADFVFGSNAEEGFAIYIEENFL